MVRRAPHNDSLVKQLTVHDKKAGLSFRVLDPHVLFSHSSAIHHCKCAQSEKNPSSLLVQAIVA